MLSYLGVTSDTPANGYGDEIAKAVEECEGVCSVSGIYRIFDIDNPFGEADDEPKQDVHADAYDPYLPIKSIGADIELSGMDVGRRLSGARQIAVFAVTLGLGSENWLRRQRRQSLSDFMVLDAAASAYVEAGAEAMENLIRMNIEHGMAGETADMNLTQKDIGIVSGAHAPTPGDQASDASAGSRLGPRFSPGYGDFALDAQASILASLDAERQLGIYLTDESLMIPTKSITAVAGIFDVENECMDVDILKYYPDLLPASDRDPIDGHDYFLEFEGTQYYQHEIEPCESCPAKEGCTLRKDGRRCYGR